MSVSNKEISSYNDDDDEDDDVDSGVHRGNQRAIGFCGFSSFSFSARLGKKAKGLVLSPLKRKKHSKPKSKAKVDKAGSGNFEGCYFCLKRSSNGQTVSPNGSQTSDPNDPNFTYDMLRVLIERNDFFCKDCNTHLDSDHD